MGKNYDSSTFSRIGQQLGARELIRGSYTIQSFGATISIAAQLVDVETGRIIGGDLAELPYTGDIKAMLACQDCSSKDSSFSPTAKVLSPASSKDGSEALPEYKATEKEPPGTIFQINISAAPAAPAEYYNSVYVLLSTRMQRRRVSLSGAGPGDRRILIWDNIRGRRSGRRRDGLTVQCKFAATCGDGS
ncbi:MAG: hypothetical protein ABSH24_20875 [Bryobacteraceae bacterium]